MGRAAQTLLDAQWTEALPDYIVEIMQNISVETSAIIAGRVKYIGRLNKSDIKRLTKAMEFAGGDIKKIEAVIAKWTGKSVAEIDKMFLKYAAKNDEFARTFYEAKGITPRTYRTDAYLASAVNAITKQTKMAFGNLSQTTAFFYKMPDGSYIDTAHAYIRTINQAIYEVQSGTMDYNTAMRATIRAIGNGTRVLEYRSGYKRRLDSAVRQNILDGVRQLNQEVMAYHGKAYGADGIELSAHAMSAPDHAEVQGHRFSNEEFDKMQMGADCVDENGVFYTGFDRPIGQWNCKHFAFPIILGIGSPAHTEEQLEAMRQSSAEKYPLTQKARAMETQLRTLKERRMTFTAAGDEEAAKTTQREINELQAQLKAFCEQTGIHYEPQRATVAGYRRIAV